MRRLLAIVVLIGVAVSGSALGMSESDKERYRKELKKWVSEYSLALAISEGVPLAAIRDLIGHSSITVTERYAHLAPERVQDVVAVLDRITSHSGHTVYGDTNAKRTVRLVTH